MCSQAVLLQLFKNKFSCVGDESKPKENEDVHVPAINLSEKLNTEKLREKVRITQEKRKIKEKLKYAWFYLYCLFLALCLLCWMLPLCMKRWKCDINDRVWDVATTEFSVVMLELMKCWRLSQYLPFAFYWILELWGSYTIAVTPVEGVGCDKQMQWLIMLWPFLKSQYSVCVCACVCVCVYACVCASICVPVCTLEREMFLSVSVYLHVCFLCVFVHLQGCEGTWREWFRWWQRSGLGQEEQKTPDRKGFGR